MKLNLNMLDDEEEGCAGIERIEKKPSFKSEEYRRERKGDSIRRKRQQKQRERDQMLEESEDFIYGTD